MKFGKQLLAQQWDDWADVYVPYKQLKKLLKCGASNPARFAEMEGLFVSTFIKSIQSINHFFESQVGVLANKIKSLRSTVNGFADCDENWSLSSVSRDANLICEGVEWLRSFAQVRAHSIHAGSLGHMTALVHHRDSGRPSTRAAWFASLTAATHSSVPLTAQYRFRLHRAAQLNQLAVQKILKKHDKLSAISMHVPLCAFFEARAFSSLTHLEGLLTDAQHMLAQCVGRHSAHGPARVAGIAGNGTSADEATHMDTTSGPPMASPARVDGSVLGGFPSSQASGAQPRSPPRSPPRAPPASLVRPSLAHLAGVTPALAPPAVQPASSTAAAPSSVLAVARCKSSGGDAGSASDTPWAEGGVGEQGSAARRQACVECHRAKSACQGYPCSRCVRLGKQCVMREKRKRRRYTRTGEGGDICGLSAAAAAATLGMRPYSDESEAQPVAAMPPSLASSNAIPVQPFAARAAAPGLESPGLLVPPMLPCSGTPVAGLPPATHGFMMHDGASGTQPTMAPGNPGSTFCHTPFGCSPSHPPAPLPRVPASQCHPTSFAPLLATHQSRTAQQWHTAATANSLPSTPMGATGALHVQPSMAPNGVLMDVNRTVPSGAVRSMANSEQAAPSIGAPLGVAAPAPLRVPFKGPSRGNRMAASSTAPAPSALDNLDILSAVALSEPQHPRVAG